jgi:outer membrane protein OmpA-like peptidoglycan-associated protein
MAAPIRVTAFACMAVAGAVLGASPASADDALRDILGKAQSGAQQQAVEDLIRKLQGARPTPPPAMPPAVTPPSALPPVPVKKATPPAAIEAHPPPEAALAPAEPKADAAMEKEPKPFSPAAPATIETRPPTEPAPAPAEPKTDVAREKPEPSAPPAAASAPPTEAPASGEPALAAAQKAVEEADRNELPSIDLEVYFEMASTQITPRAAAALDPLGRALTDARLAGGVFLIAGHTDGYGPARYNLRLSQRRAESVRRYLVETYAIDPERLIAQGFGKERPKNPKNPRADENRRVQIVNMTAQAYR